MVYFSVHFNCDPAERKLHVKTHNTARLFFVELLRRTVGAGVRANFPVVLTFLLAAVLGVPAEVSAGDWPVWMGPGGRNASVEVGLPETFDPSGEDGSEAGHNVKWSARLGMAVYGCPTVSNGKVFAGTSIEAVRDDKRFSRMIGGVVLCMEESTGRVIWRLVTPERQDGFPENTVMNQQRWGICSSPTVEGDRLYVVSNGDDVLCLDIEGMANGNDGPFKDEARFMAGAGEDPIELTKADGDIIWRYDIPRELSVAPHDVASCSMVIHDGVVYTSTSNGVGKDHPAGLLKPEAPSFIALDAQTGKLLAVDDLDIGKNIWHTQWSSPSIGKVGGKTLILLGGGDGVCYAFEAFSRAGRKSGDGPELLKTAWSYDCNPLRYRFRDGKEIPYYNGDVRKFKNLRRRRQDTTGFNSGDGDYVGPSQIIATPVFHDDRVYIPIGQDPAHGYGAGMLHCIDATGTGDITKSGRIWTYNKIGRTICTVSVAGGLVYAADLEGRLYCLDAETGREYWVHDTKHETWGSPLIADGKIYLNTTLSFWILAEGKTKEVLFSCRQGSECAPIAANGVVYTVLRDHLYALKEGG